MFTMGQISLPKILRSPLEAATRVSLYIPGDPAVDFLNPKNDPALILHDSVSWRVFKNPLALFIGGIAAVLLELAEPRVRTGVWEHSQFRSQPLARMRRTGLAALTTIYAARSVSQNFIARIVRVHEMIEGVTPAGQRYRANDPELLTWVHGTAAFSFFEAYSRYVCPQLPRQFDLYCREGLAVATLFGALNAPSSEYEMIELFEAKKDDLEPSEIIFEFLEIVRIIPILPSVLRPLQRVFVSAAIGILPLWVRKRLELGKIWDLTRGEAALVKLIGVLSDKVIIPSNPAVEACVRLGLPENYLYQPAVMKS